ncbi:unnamed protein product, partial [marine sediment metagenome]
MGPIPQAMLPTIPYIAMYLPRMSIGAILATKDTEVG